MKTLIVHGGCSWPNQKNPSIWSVNQNDQTNVIIISARIAINVSFCGEISLLVHIQAEMGAVLGVLQTGWKSVCKKN